jgi:hypothetical protein
LQFVTEFPNIPPSVGSLEYAGNGLRGKASNIQQSARGMYLLPHVKLPKAVIVSFFAYFVRYGSSIDTHRGKGTEKRKVTGTDGIAYFCGVRQITAQTIWRNSHRLSSSRGPNLLHQTIFK